MAHSQRARILSRVLDYINNDDFEEEGLLPFMIFGKEAFHEWLHRPKGAGGDDMFWNGMVDQARQLMSDLQTRQGEVSASERTSVAGTPPARAPRAKDLARVIEQVTGRPPGAATQGGVETESSLTEKLDRFYTKLVLDKLDDVINRASDLEPVGLELDNATVQEYFKEAHDLYLFGFRIGAAVLCRALIDSALEDKFGGQNREKSGKYEPGETPLLWKAAGESGPLDEHDVKHAAWVREAGNRAIHRLDEFRRDFTDDEKLAELISVARTIFSKMSSWTGPSTSLPK